MILKLIEYMSLYVTKSETSNLVLQFNLNLVFTLSDTTEAFRLSPRQSVKLHIRHLTST